ncbi:adenylosuccinate lyase, partial [Candidatus Bathyarchaeota archaeon]|nr:adenylosuccinate lyase [Candidatus Bathyarchaeota archaeon]
SPALENIPTWHERDLTQSSCERFVIPEECILIDYMLILMIGVLSGLQIDKKRMRKNMDITQGRMMSEAVMLSLAKKGLGRQKSHELTRQLSIESHNEQRPFKEVLAKNNTIKEFFTPNEIEQVMDPQNYLGTAFKQIELVIQKTKNERKERKLSN